MNRPLKFRAWTGATMEYNVMVGKFGAFYCAGIDPDDSACLSAANTIYGDATPVMQWTGLFDKNGREIWEGDILQTYKWNGKEIQKDKIGKVFWHPYACRFSIAIDGGLGVIFDLNTTSGGMYGNKSHDEVIGNVYQNPELLTK